MHFIRMFVYPSMRIKMATRFKLAKNSYSTLSRTIIQSSRLHNSIYKELYLYSSSRNFSWIGFVTFISQSTPVLTFQDLLLNFHQMSGLSWWSVIMLTTIGIRSLIIFPLTVHQNQVVARLDNLKKELGTLAPELNKEVNIASHIYKWDLNHSKKVFKQNMHRLYKERVIRDNCHPFKTILLVLIQIPVWICFSFALRNLCYMVSFPYILNKPDAIDSLMKLKTEGALWFIDLTIPDKIILPFLLASINLLLIELHALRPVGQNTLLKKCILHSMRVLTIVVAVAASVNPTCISFYWLCSSTFGLAQNLVFMFPRVRRFLRIPTTGKESLSPFKDIVSNIKSTWFKTK